METAKRAVPGMVIAAGFLALLSASPQIALAQGAFSIWGGLAKASQDYDFTDSASNSHDLSRRDYTIGVNGDIYLNPSYDLRIGVSYIRKGSQYTVFRFTQGGSRYLDTVDSRIDYISLPLQVHAHTDFHKSSFYVVAGLRMDIRVGVDDPDTSSVLDELETAVIGGTLGLGFELGLSDATGAYLEAAYHPDFTHAFNSKSLTVKNQALTLVVGYRLRFGYPGR